MTKQPTNFIGHHCMEEAAAPNNGRRRFVQGLAAGGILAATGAWAPRARATMGGIPVLSGTDIALSIGMSDVNFTGSVRQAITVNGMLPAPVIRLREGDQVAIRVSNRLEEPSSIHWHGLLLPFDMDGVPGVAFPGIGAQESFLYKFKVQQSGTYWYHSHSGFQEQLGLYGPFPTGFSAGSGSHRIFSIIRCPRWASLPATFAIWGPLGPLKSAKCGMKCA
jgi:hypothetical protein